MFKKLALASLISVAASGAFALEAVDEATLAETTGQQGIDIFTSLNVSGATLTYTDADGYTYGAGTYNNSGDLLINNLGMTGSVKVAIDAGSTAAGPNAALNVAINGTTALAITLDSITVKKTGGATAYNILTMPAGTSINIATGYNIDLELGKGGSGHLGRMTGNLGTITIGDNATSTAKVAVVDATNGGQMGVSRFQVSGVNLGDGTSNNFTNMDVCDGTTVTAACAAGENGLKIKYGSVSTDAVMNGMTLTMNDVRVGAAAAPVIGQISITGLSLAGTSMRIVGH